MSRGKDNVIVDPSPYGSLSTLTSNAPAIRSPQLPKNYQPGQGYWGAKTGFTELTQRASGIVVARCDYADQFAFQERATDIPEALRDLVMVPSADGKNAAVVVIDRADTGGADREMYIKFRTPGALVANGDTATATIGATKLTIASVVHSSGTPKVAKTALKDCFGESVDRGNCDAARVPVTDYRLVLAGPAPNAVHVIGATDAGTTITTTPRSGADWAGIDLGGMRPATIIWRTKGSTGPLSYTAPPGMHVVLDTPDKATIIAKLAGKDCAVEISAGGSEKNAMHAPPVIVSLDAACTVSPDPETSSKTPANALQKPSSSRVRSPRGGCCGAQSGPASPAAGGALVLLWLWPRRKTAKKR